MNGEIMNMNDLFGLELDVHFEKWYLVKKSWKIMN